jgi:hypothetical protein
MSEKMKDITEVKNALIAAIGTGIIAPAIILVSPGKGDKEDKDKKFIQALRQPLSAGLQLAFQVPVTNRINKYIDVEYAFQRISNVPEWFEIPKDRTKPWGTTQALLSVENIVNEPFAVINADDFYGRQAFEIIANHLKNVNTHSNKPIFCMAGYLLKNTITEHGAVNRGVCYTNSNGYLINILETKEIVAKNSSYAEYHIGDQTLTLDLNTIVSINCWGFTPEIFPYLSKEFDKFLMTIKDPLKEESYLPSVVDTMVNNDACEVIVYNTQATWLGVTYAEDKPSVVNGIQKMIDAGIYPEHLWK